MKIDDDPFETSLDLNYHLMQEEAAARERREAALNARLTELSAAAAVAGKVLDPKWIQHITEELAKKNATCYKERIQKLKAAPGVARTTLFTLKITGAELGFCSEARLSNDCDVADAIRQLDPRAEHPTEMGKVGFCFARRIGILWKSLNLSIRSYPLPVLAASELNLSGVLIAHELSNPPEIEKVTRRVVDVGNGLTEVVRDGSMLKWYHGLHMGSEDFTYSWGPCFDAVMQQVANRFALIADRGVVCTPSNGIDFPWYDKLRVLRHGPLILTSKRFTLRSSPPP